MKLRMKQNSIRLRVTRSELSHLQAGEDIQESVRFTAEPDAVLVYVLRTGPQVQPVTVTFASQRIVVTLSQSQLTNWSAEDQVGVYASSAVDTTTALEVAIEKDFACLDKSDEDNKDTFANPLAGAVC
jgi:hypothetical protein